MWSQKLVCLAVTAAAISAATVLAATDDEPQALGVGDAAVDFALQDENGDEFTLAGYAGEKNVLLLFSRAHW